MSSRIAYLVAQRLAGAMGLRASLLFPSPSKFFLLRRLVRVLRECEGMQIGLDAACANFKSRELFLTERYVGLDLNEAILRQGKEMRAQPTDRAIHSDLLRLADAPGSADIVVSTHTLASIPFDLRMDALHALVTSTAGNGTLFFNIPLESDSAAVKTLLQSSFGRVERELSQTAISRKFERFFASRTSSKNPFMQGMLAIAILAAIAISFLEEFKVLRIRCAAVVYTCRFRFLPTTESRLSSLEALAI